jgi:DNA-binding NarL/FixJ family response regulator
MEIGVAGRGRNRMSRVLVLVVSDNQSEVRVLREIVREQTGGDAIVVGAAGRGEQAWSRALALRPHVVLVTVDPEKDGDIEIVPRLRGLFVDVGIVVLAATGQTDLGEATRVAGADFTVVQSQVHTALAPALREAGQLARTRQRMADQSSLEQTP